MPVIASWIREKDERWFADSLSGHGGADFIVRNARRGEAIDLSTIGALLLTGGEDIAAEYLHQPVPDPAILDEPVRERDAWEFAATTAAVARGIPIFGVCKGLQVLNVVLGGTLHLDIRGHNLPEQKSANVQPLRHDAGNPAAWRYDRVNSSHHQAIDRLGDGLEVLAWCETDTIIEQVRSRKLPWCVGVQYHPERDPEFYRAVFAEFVDAVPG
jgi:putative glutamine amidotransferase